MCTADVVGQAEQVGSDTLSSGGGTGAGPDEPPRGPRVPRLPRFRRPPAETDADHAPDQDAGHAPDPDAGLVRRPVGGALAGGVADGGGAGPEQVAGPGRGAGPGRTVERSAGSRPTTAAALDAPSDHDDRSGPGGPPASRDPSAAGGTRWWRSRRVLVASAALAVGATIVGLRQGAPAPPQGGGPSSSPERTSGTVAGPLRQFSVLVESEGTVSRYTATGRDTVRRDLPMPADLPRPILGEGGWLTTTRSVVLLPTPDRRRVALVIDTDGANRRIGPADLLLPGVQGRSLWLVDRSTGRTRVSSVLLDGTVERPPQDAPAGLDPVAVTASGIVMRRGPTGGFAIWSPRTNRVRSLDLPSLAGGRVVSTGGDYLIVAAGCPTGVQCRYELVSVGQGTAQPVRLRDTLVPLGYPTLSPDGLWLAAPVDPDAGDGRIETALAVGTTLGRGDDADVVPGSRSAVPGGTSAVDAVVEPAWSGDDRVFLNAGVGRRARLVSYRPGEVAARTVPAALVGTVAGLRAL